MSKRLALLALAAMSDLGNQRDDRCPRFDPEPYGQFYAEQFEESNGGEVLYFSNVNFERLFVGPPADERYVSEYAIQLQYTNETGEDCFLPFELVRKSANMSRESSRWQNTTVINAQIIAVVNQEHMMAFSCAEVGNKKLEYIWILRNRRGDRIDLKRIKQLFGRWLDSTTTTAEGLINYHDQLQLCPDQFWEFMTYIFTGVALFIALIAAIVHCMYKFELRQERREREKPTSRTSTTCLNDHFHLMISQDAVEEWTPMAGKETNLPVLLVASKDGKHGLESAVSENESDGLIMIVIPVTCCYWIYLGVCTVFRKMCGKCAR
ncbi:hypothetical protein quinque_008328 [Culex quinquefasciatus]